MSKSNTKPIPEEARRFLSEIAKKGGQATAKRGPEYYKRIRKLVKNPGRKKKELPTGKEE